MSRDGLQPLLGSSSSLDELLKRVREPVERPNILGVPVIVTEAATKDEMMLVPERRHGESEDAWLARCWKMENIG